MIKVSVMYPYTPGVRFDHDYYKTKHMPLVKARMGDACKYYTIDKGLAGGAPGAPATYVGMCHIFADSVDAFQTAFGPHHSHTTTSAQPASSRLRPASCLPSAAHLSSRTSRSGCSRR